MKVVLLENLPGLGNKGDIKNVSDGYAVNFLLPQRKATLATAPTVAKIQHIQDQQEKNLAEQQKNYAKIKKVLDHQTLNFFGKVSDKGHLFAGIGQLEISQLVKQNYGLDLHSNWYLNTYFFKAVGKYQVQLKLPNNEIINIDVNIKALT